MQMQKRRSYLVKLNIVPTGWSSCWYPWTRPIQTRSSFYVTMDMEKKIVQPASSPAGNLKRVKLRDRFIATTLLVVDDVMSVCDTAWMVQLVWMMSRVSMSHQATINVVTWQLLSLNSSRSFSIAFVPNRTSVANISKSWQPKATASFICRSVTSSTTLSSDRDLHQMEYLQDVFKESKRLPPTQKVLPPIFIFIL